VHFYFKEDPEEGIKREGLDWFAKRWRRLEFALEFDGKITKKK
jgi:hypothetical protein